MKKHLDPRSLKALLRQGDPAEALSEEKSARVRERLAAAVTEPNRQETPEARSRVMRWEWITAAGLGALILAIGLWQGVTHPKSSTGPERPVSLQPAAPAMPRTQIDFATPGGTRIIWTLIPEGPHPRPLSQLPLPDPGRGEKDLERRNE